MDIWGGTKSPPLGAHTAFLKSQHVFHFIVTVGKERDDEYAQQRLTLTIH